MWKAARIVISLIILIPVLTIILSAFASNLFHQMVAKEVNGFLINSSGKTGIVTKADLAGLPECVQKWLEFSQVVGKERIKTVRLKQKALMRLAPGGKTMTVEAVQYIRVDRPGFIWQAKVNMAPLLYLAGRDKYLSGKGQMLIKLMALKTIVDASGEKVDQGSMLRYLAEAIWYPTAALSDYIKWEELDAHSAKATMTYGGISASAVFTFDDQGRPVRFYANRYRDAGGGQYQLTGWGGTDKSFREFNGIRIANKGEVFWELDSGTFNWFDWEITDIEYNQPVMY